MRTSDLNKLKNHLNAHPHYNECLELKEWEERGRPYCWTETVQYGDVRAYADAGYGYLALLEGDHLTTSLQNTCIGRDFIAYCDDNGLKLFKKVAG